MKEFYLKYISENQYIVKYIDGSHYKSLIQAEKREEKQSLDFLKDGSTKKKKQQEES